MCECRDVAEALSQVESQQEHYTALHLYSPDIDKEAAFTFESMNDMVPTGSKWKECDNIPVTPVDGEDGVGKLINSSRVADVRLYGIRCGSSIPEYVEGLIVTGAKVQ